jgi:carboxylate-amine ligase
VTSAFGASPPLSLGVEEELMILDAGSLDQVPAVERLLAAADPDVPGVLKTELFASIVETNTLVCADSREVAAALPALRRAAAGAAAAEGLVLAAAGTHPFARPEDQPIVQEERYTSFAATGGITVRRQGVQGLHVHVGMANPESCWRCLEAVLPWLPVVLALSANSPWLAGELTGMSSNRAPVLAELPRAGVPPAFASYTEWQTWVDRLLALGAMPDATRIWWDVRPHPALGTLEIRVADQPTDVELSAAFATLLQALCAVALEDGLPSRGGLLGDRGRADYLQNRWAAAHQGPRAELLHPDGSSYVSAEELGGELLELVRPAARSLGGERLIDVIDPAACEADVQARFESPSDCAADLVGRSIR